MSRNPHATNLRHHHQRIVPDKRGEELWRSLAAQAEDVAANPGDHFVDVTDMTREERSRVFLGD